MRCTLRQIKFFVCMSVFAVTLALPSLACADNVQFRAELVGTEDDPLAKGVANWVRDNQTGVRQLKIDIQDVATTDLAMAFVNGRFVGLIEIENGAGKLELTTAEGDAVPRVATGSVAEIRRADDGVLILSGTFAPN